MTCYFFFQVKAYLNVLFKTPFPLDEHHEKGGCNRTPPQGDCIYNVGERIQSAGIIGYKNNGSISDVEFIYFFLLYFYSYVDV